jgi:hypothetical protein
MPEGEEIRLRQLPAGRVRHGYHRSLRGRMLEVEMASGEDAGGLDTGALVEVDGERTLYLGELYSRDGICLVIAVDHVVDRKELAAIQDTWDRAGRH